MNIEKLQKNKKKINLLLIFMNYKKQMKKGK
jgi:hypothetical protein